jgi:hypothetical protein
VRLKEGYTLDPDEIWRIWRIRVAEHLHVLPSQVDEMPFADVCDVLEVMRADGELSKFRG